ncbi:MAG: response regulator [Chitinivibrionales bacterium]|nr:response regulator [Chitinivibrionales bacterium]MBD3357481.1 response regulator [Chitinivibrionales bacterium]
MKTFDRTRRRLLVICRDHKVRSDLVTLLTGYGYFVDYVEDRHEGIAKFKQHKQAVVIIDVPALPQFPESVFREFRVYSRNPIILIAAHKDEQRKVYPYLDEGAYDIIELPLKADYLHFRLRRLVAHSALEAVSEFRRFLISALLFALPVWLALIRSFAR